MDSSDLAQHASHTRRFAATWKVAALIFAAGIPLGWATIGAVLFVFIAPLIIHNSSKHGENPWGSLAIPLLALGTVSAMSSVLSGAPTGGLLFSLGLLLVGGSSLIAGRHIARDAHFLRGAFLPTLVVSAIAISAYVLYQYFGLHMRRTTGLISYTNRMGTLLMFSGILGVGYLLGLKGRTRWLALPYGILLAVAMSTTLSRAAWLGSLVGTVILALRWPRQGLAFLLVALLAGSGLLASQPVWQARFLSTFSMEGNMDRLEMWEASVKIFMDHPLAGIGPTRFPAVAPEYIEKENWWPHATPHNFFLTVAAELGLAGMFALAWLGIRTAREIRALWRRGDPLSWGMVAALVALIVNDFFGQGFYTSQVGAVLWLTLGLVDGWHEGRPDENRTAAA